MVASGGRHFGQRRRWLAGHHNLGDGASIRGARADLGRIHAIFMPYLELIHDAT
jgi:hypothetical protein